MIVLKEESKCRETKMSRFREKRRICNVSKGIVIDVSTEKFDSR